MINWNKNLTTIRVLIIFTCLLLLTVIYYNFIRITSSPTDENQWISPQFKYYLTKNIPAQKIIGKNDSASNDMIYLGMFILSVNGKNLENTDTLELQHIIEKSSSQVELVVLDPVQGANDYNMKGEMNTIKYSVKKEDLPADFYKYIPSILLIINVTKGGASDRAGILTGDVIITINSNTFSDGWEADKYLRSSDFGKYLTYRILRYNETKDINVQLAKFGATFQFLLNFLIGNILLFFGAFLFIKKPAIKAARIIGTGFILAGIAIGASYNRYHYDYDTFSLIRATLVSFSVSLVYPLFIHSAFYFPKEKPWLLSKRYLYIVPYIFGFLFWVTVIITYLIIRNQNLDRVIDIFLNVGLFLLFIIYIFILSLYQRKKIPKDTKRQSRALKYGLISLVILDSLNLVLFNIFGILPVPEINILSILIIPAVYYYTIARYNLLDMKISIKRNIQYNLVTIIWQTFSVVIICIIIWFLAGMEMTIPNIHLTGTSIEILEKPLRPQKEELFEKLIIVTASIIFGFLILKLRKKIQAMIDKRFYRMKFDYQTGILKISEAMEAFNMKELANGIVEKISELMNVRKVGVVFFKNEMSVAEQSYIYNNYSGIPEQSDFSLISEFTRDNGITIIESLKLFSNAVRIDYLPKQLKEVYQENKFQFILPVKSKGKLVGAFQLGEKLSEVSFNNEDFDFLNSIVSQAAISIENVFLYEDLAQQERIRHELNLARKIQLSSLPDSIPDIEGLDISGISIPAFEVGGDFYDFLNGKTNDLTVIVGDVSGKGTSAALYMSKTQGIIRTLYEFDLTPRQLFIRANNLLYKSLEKTSFISVIGFKIDLKNKTLNLARAGHLPMFCIKPGDNSIIKHLPKGIALGLGNNLVFDKNIEECEINFQSGDIFILISDGVLDARNESNIEFGEDNLIELLKNIPKNNAQEIRDIIISSLKSYTGNTTQYDDLTVVVVKII